MPISAKHGLVKEELKFCQVYDSFGRTNPAEAYRRSFLVRKGGEYWEPDRDGKIDMTGDPVPAKLCARRAQALLKQPHISSYLDELNSPAGDRARAELHEQVLFGDPQQAARASTRLLDDEDKLGFRDAVELHTMVQCAIGTEVHAPLPDGGKAIFDMREMYPTYSDALPPPDVLVKTMKSLDQYLWVQEQKLLGTEKPDPRNWKFLAGHRAYTARTKG